MRRITGIFSFLWKCYIGIIFAILAIALYPFFLVLLSNKKWKRASFKLFVFWSWMMRFLCFYRVKKIRRKSLPNGPYIIISNHSSYLDIFFMHSIMPNHPFLFLGKSEILGYPIIRTYFKGLNIPVHRKDRGKSATSYILAKKAVNEGWSLVIFPEGGIPDDGAPKMMPFKIGAFKLAKELNIPIVPLTFVNHFKLFSDPLDLFGRARPGISKVHIHEPISVMQIEEMSEKELSNFCFERINTPLKREYPELIENN